MILINNNFQIEHIRLYRLVFLDNKFKIKYKLENGILFRDYGPLENAPNTL